MTKKKAIFAVLSVIVVVALGALAMYVCPFNAGFKPHAFRQQRLYKDLGLTKEQKQSLEENKNKNKEQMKALFQNMREKTALVRQELQKEQLDMVKITQLNNELKQLQAQMLDYKLQSILEVRKILTPEQFRKFSAKMEKRAGHFKDKRERPEGTTI
jgi:Spy/CpxP family protein refolding chaperone